MKATALFCLTAFGCLFFAACETEQKVAETQSEQLETLLESAQIPEADDVREQRIQTWQV
jgi:hypothetical protein